jgi:hypothetical protein
MDPQRAAAVLRETQVDVESRVVVELACHLLERRKIRRPEKTNRVVRLIGREGVQPSVEGHPQICEPKPRELG